MRNRLFVVLALALTAGGGLAYGTYNYMQNVPVRTVSVPTQPVVVAAADLQLGTALSSSDVRVVQWPASDVPEGAFRAPQEIEGRGLIVPVVKNEVILPSKLAAKEAGAGLPPVIPPGMRAMSVRVNEVIGVAGYVLPGNRVDVIATATPTQQQTDVTSKVVLTNVQVLTAGTRMEQNQDSGKPVQVTVVTLLVSPEEAERLTLASTEGKIQLALRNPLDTGSPTTPGIRPAALLGAAMPAPPVRRAASASSTAKAAPPATPEPQPLPTVEVIRGDKRAREVIR
jgi:pilus assembly protein CpaB